MNLALLGPSGAGKGTHVASLVRRYGLRHLATGELLRHHLEHRSALGILARKYLEQSELVPDELVDAMIEAWIRALPAGHGALFDGFPRTSHQAIFLDAILAELGRKLDAVVYLNVGDEEIVRRVSGRWICRGCQEPFHASDRPPKTPGVCDRCGGALYRRPDDTPERSRARLRVFHRASGPLFAHYVTLNRLLVVPGEGTIEAVDAALAAELDAVAAGRGRFASRLDAAGLLLPPSRRPMVEAGPAERTVVLLGPPGAGKGTEAAHLAEWLQVPHLATGDLFREHLKRGSELGGLARHYIERGELVPDDVTEAMLEERLARPDARPGFVLDGFPRTLAQAHALSEWLAHAGRRVEAALYLNVPDAVITARLAGRLICGNCQSPFHRLFRPPLSEGKCDWCGGALQTRPDDAPEAIARRLAAFHRETEPVIDYYRRAGVLFEIPGDGPVIEVARRCRAAIGSRVEVPAAHEPVPRGSEFAS